MLIMLYHFGRSFISQTLTCFGLYYYSFIIEVGNCPFLNLSYCLSTEACPFCRRVREAMTELDLSVEVSRRFITYTTFNIYCSFEWVLSLIWALLFISFITGSMILWSLSTAVESSVLAFEHFNPFAIKCATLT